MHNLETILAAAGRRPLSTEEATCLLNTDTADGLEAVFKAARDVRRVHFGDKVFLYGFLYISTHCRNDCRFCFFRKSNTQSRRYRKKLPEILQAASSLADSGVHLIDLTMGEDPVYVNNGARGYEKLESLVASIRETTGLPIMISPGLVPDDILGRLAKAGVDWYACYQETHRQGLFQHLRPAQSYGARLMAKRTAHRRGMLIEEGLRRGVG